MGGTGERWGLAGLGCGLVATLFGVYFSIYTVCPSSLAACTHPYEGVGFPLEIGAGALLTAGALLWLVSFHRRPRAGPRPGSVDPGRLVAVPIGPAAGSVFDGGILKGMEAGVARRAQRAAACPRCGSPLPEAASFCPECGTPIEG